MSLRAAAIRSLPQYRQHALRPVLPLLKRAYATPSNNNTTPRPSRNAPTPAGLEGLFGGRSGIATPKPPGAEGVSGPSAPKTPDVQLPEGQTGPEAEQLGKEAEGETSEEKVEKRKEKIQQKLGEGSKGNRLAGGGGGGGGSGKGGNGGAGGPGGAGNGGPGGMSQNQLVLAAVA